MKKTKKERKDKKEDEAVDLNETAAQETDQFQEEDAAIQSSQESASKKRKRKRHSKANDDKRPKLDSLGEAKVEKQEAPTEATSFRDFVLDERILKAIGAQGWTRPTEVQSTLIALALEDRNVLARARTGSGKTAAFLLPTLHKILQFIQTSSNSKGPYAIIVTPTKELSTQVHRELARLTSSLSFLTSLDLAAEGDNAVRAALDDEPSFVVSTPSRLVSVISTAPSFLENVRHVVLDEADLLLSYGYENEMKTLRKALPEKYQCIMTSATLEDDMSVLKKLFMTGPVVSVKLQEGELPAADQLTQYQLSCADEEQKFAILIALFKLRLIAGKSIIFVKDPDRCYQLQIVLGAFGVRACVLNAALPANCRAHTVSQFNEGKFSLVIASDASDVIGANPEAKKENSEKKGKKRVKGLDRESGVGRGIDFHHVSNVINFDLPDSIETYIHRVGRTARGWNKGTALSFATTDEKAQMDHIQEEINDRMGRKVMIPYEIRIKELESFVLRAREALAACTRTIIKEARLAEIRDQALRSKKLAGFFAKNPRERDLLAGDRRLHSLNMHNPAISDVPDYMVPKALRGTDYGTSSNPKSKKKGMKGRKKLTQQQKKHASKQADPLRSFKI